jgi:hypothetical protein
MISERSMKEADKLAHKIIDLFQKDDVATEIALLAMTRVIATCLCDQDDVGEKIKKIIHNLVVMEEQCRGRSYQFNN